MRARFELSLETAPETQCWGSNVRLADQGAFAKIASLGFKILERCGEHTYQRINIELPPDDERLRRVLEILKAAGISVYDGVILPSELRTSHFTPLRFRDFEEADLSGSEYLSLQRSNDPREWQKGYIASSWRFQEPTLHVSNDPQQRVKLQFGVTDCGKFWLCEAQIADALGKKALKGLRCVPTVFEEVDRAGRRPLRLIWSDLRMARCLTQRQDADTGKEFDPATSTVSWWNDGRWITPVLRFRRAEVAAMQSFDVALTQEQTGEIRLKELQTPEIIVSQCFRTAMKEIGVEDIFYAPVELV